MQAFQHAQSHHEFYLAISFTMCFSMRPTKDFLVNQKKKGNINKFCEQHSEKRWIRSLVSWDNFLSEVYNWSQSIWLNFPICFWRMERAYIVSQHSQTTALEIKCTLGLDQLPVTFEIIKGVPEEGNEKRSASNDVNNQAVQIICKNYWISISSCCNGPKPLFAVLIPLLPVCQVECNLRWAERGIGAKWQDLIETVIFVLSHSYTMGLCLLSFVTNIVLLTKKFAWGLMF